jgi:hypothetical protein
MIDLTRALVLAAEAHRTQADKAGAPYILHPLRVMMRMGTDEERIVAILHDVLEDGGVEFKAQVRSGLADQPRLLRALESLAKREGEHGDEGYGRFIERVARDELASRVKIADLEDNLDVKRLEEVGPEDAARLTRYLAAMRKLQVRSENMEQVS